MFDVITLAGDAMFAAAGFLSAKYLLPTKVEVEKNDPNVIILNEVDYGRLHFVLTKYIAFQHNIRQQSHYCVIGRDYIKIGDTLFKEGSKVL